jgi:hypothetical protein
MLKLNKLFYFVDEKETFCKRIEPSAPQRELLVKCKNDIRDHLRSEIKKATKLLIMNILAHVSEHKVLGHIKPVYNRPICRLKK